MTQNDDTMSLRSGTKYVYSTDTQQANDLRDLKFKDSTV